MQRVLGDLEAVVFVRCGLAQNINLHIEFCACRYEAIMLIYLAFLSKPETEDSVEVGEEGAVKRDPESLQVVRQHWLQRSLSQMKYH